MSVILGLAQSQVFKSEKRFRVLVAGRRFGKTYLALVELMRAAWKPGRCAWYVGPTYKQAKRIAWSRLKNLSKPYWAGKPNETELRIELITGGTIALKGADNYDSLRGDGLDFIVLDEYASMAPEAWTEVLRPSLSDRMGGALFSGTPQGFNHFHDLYDRAQSDSDWAGFQFTTEEGENVLPTELESAARELDARTYRQEFQACFENLGFGKAYHAFDRQANVRDLAYRASEPLIWSLDFNINPMCSILAQMHEGSVHVLNELVLPDSNTLAACNQFAELTEQWCTGKKIQIIVHGDSSGDSRQTSASRTDWQIVKEFLGRYSDRYEPVFRSSGSNPPVKDRINCVNAMLRNQLGEVRLSVNSQCKQLIKDFEQVSWKTDANKNALMEIDKSDPARSHVSDALGYYIARKFSMRPDVGYR